MTHTDTITPDQAGTLDGLFRLRTQRTPHWPAYSYFDKAQASWQTLTWQTMHDLVGRWQAALNPARLRPGDRVAILLRNGPDWVAVEQAALGMGLVVVPLYLEDRPDNINYILNDAGVRVLVVPDAEYWEKIHTANSKPLDDLQLVILVDGATAPRSPWEHTIVRTTQEWLVDKPQAVTPRNGDRHALATIVYTSGTTGKPKGVMLSHHNILTSAAGSGKAMGIKARMSLLSFLPLSHMFERTTGYYAPMLYGMHITYTRSIAQLAEDLREIRPQVLIAVPRIFERFHEKIQEGLTKRSWLTRQIFSFATYVGWQRFLYRQGQRAWSPLFLFWPLLHRKIAAPLLQCFGGALQLSVSGGAPLPQPIARLFIGLGVNLIQGYGMTECSPVVCANRPHKNDPASVGATIEGMQVRIGDHDELQVKGHGVMLGYWNNHKATHNTMTEDGWLHTGDKARIVDDMIYITGRIKDILVMSNGEKIPPVDMEEAITLDPLFLQALIIGEARSYLSALVVLNAEHWFTFAQALGVNPQDPDALNNPRINKAVLDRIATALRGFPGYAKVRRVSLLLEPWTVENGLLTPTLKTKRQLVVEQLADKVAAMYH